MISHKSDLYRPGIEPVSPDSQSQRSTYCANRIDSA
jgi:hypothetical protein